MASNDLANSEQIIVKIPVPEPISIALLKDLFFRYFFKNLAKIMESAPTHTLLSNSG